MIGSRKADIKLAGRFKRLVQQEWCVYCGAMATTKDHFVPVSVVASLMSVGVNVSGKFLVPACGECNSIAGDRIFVSIGAKRRYIQNRLSEKYNKLLNMPNWSDSELAELGYSMRSSVLAGLAQREYIRHRIRWKNSFNAEPAKIAAVRLRAGVFGIKKAVNDPSGEERARRSRERSLSDLRKENRYRVNILA